MQPDDHHPSHIELDADLDAALADLRRTFPGVCLWYGDYSGSLWALLPNRLVEAKNAAELAYQLRAALGPPRPAGRDTSAAPPSTRRRDGTWSPPRREAVNPRPTARPGLLTRLATACRRWFPGYERPARHALPTHCRPGRGVTGPADWGSAIPG
ncbi:hypothetical protein [Actinomadura sp. WAC 06369]|uniref:hypothetical protein n=1 Tax=Actinomadura sp. WAC 06369 TaxID=2203193 RepID=UPI000F78F005|nr:hypothetical protein [Actinomadura sp. WAC 06369]RSN44329.1 hypothetical protein DMH08_37350 [Actinomadura sp. WAC 06369]